jgi:hypothetical protein
VVKPIHKRILWFSDIVKSESGSLSEKEATFHDVVETKIETIQVSLELLVREMVFSDQTHEQSYEESCQVKTEDIIKYPTNRNLLLASPLEFLRRLLNGHYLALTEVRKFPIERDNPCGL